ncbi:hypothetical protein GCM10010497_46040 [Streptomyces cinereoruber]|uniref:Uncharacterized protein n=1 Tax=Streptomyces cinereoruber TaxID=67260 RepID=A0AAV4KPL8_9ACTN|nr:hypothetical protein [Streptomyces cinereoruber]MBB4160073.1 hypothetical protein [Streptomyces cinereoruber]MBY8818316.1 hypothetical protein [Streptomyces cinereoruber]NIH61011.1 hypothetical protein [Streptomyces cinereoruber]QEV33276.1 hypothetical protein CP977_14790 [Streptomyces cinereoruber]GGR37953.1 hypothetical protein GCM10010497_46040 [Streptomyces cinereoruber]
MRIRIVSVASVADGAGHRYSNGQTVTVDDDLARSWIAAGHARPATRAAGRDGNRARASAARKAKASEDAKATTAEASPEAEEPEERKAPAPRKRTATKRAPRTAKKPDTDDE